MTDLFSASLVAAGIFNLAFAAFHISFWKLFRWPASLGSIGSINRSILYILNMAVTWLFALVGLLLLVYPGEVETTGLGWGLLWGMAFFWLARAAIQPPVFGLRKPLSMALFLIFLLGAALHGFAALSRSAV